MMVWAQPPLNLVSSAFPPLTRGFWPLESCRTKLDVSLYQDREVSFSPVTQDGFSLLSTKLLQGTPMYLTHHPPTTTFLMHQDIHFPTTGLPFKPSLVAPIIGSHVTYNFPEFPPPPLMYPNYVETCLTSLPPTTMQLFCSGVLVALRFFSFKPVGPKFSQGVFSFSVWYVLFFRIHCWGKTPQVEEGSFLFVF